MKEEIKNLIKEIGADGNIYLPQIAVKISSFIDDVSISYVESNEREAYFLVFNPNKNKESEVIEAFSDKDYIVYKDKEKICIKFNKDSEIIKFDNHGGAYLLKCLYKIID